jgi:hypothetical protein
MMHLLRNGLEKNLPQLREYLPLHDNHLQVLSKQDVQRVSQLSDNVQVLG